MSEVTRKADGTFEKGVSGNPNGRPPKAREAAYLAVAHEIAGAQQWRAVVNKAVQDALGIVIVEGRATPDEKSTAVGRNAARAWLRDTLIGRPPQAIRLNEGEDDPYQQFSQYTDDQLAAIIAAANTITSESAIQPDSGSSGTGESGVTETE